MEGQKQKDGESLSEIFYKAANLNANTMFNMNDNRRYGEFASELPSELSVPRTSLPHIPSVFSLVRAPVWNAEITFCRQRGSA